MNSIKFSNRHNQLIKLMNNIDVLRLGQTNREYIEMIENLRSKVIKEIKIEQKKAGIQVIRNPFPIGQERNQA